ncbi:hypothetical protein A2U01_0107135, partial [Trifolium medium]|nr:hypothetical protein [Trifolium medium]
RRMEAQKIELEHGKQVSKRPAAPSYGEEGIKIPERQIHREDVSAPRAEKELAAPTEGVRVGDIVVELGARKV